MFNTKDRFKWNKAFTNVASLFGIDHAFIKKTDEEIGRKPSKKRKKSFKVDHHKEDKHTKMRRKMATYSNNMNRDRIKKWKF